MIGKRYLVQEQLGEGAMGQVVRALDRMTNKQVAIKRLKTQSAAIVSDSHSRMVALAHEFRILAGLRHPHIISVLDYGFETPQQPYVVMDYLEGAIDFVRYVGGLPAGERLLPFIQLLQALVYLHRRGVVHRDLKPANVVVTHAGQVKVLDFGLAGDSGSHDVGGGTLLYMAPEVLLGGPTTPASDLYAVGVMLYEVLTGQHPFRAMGHAADFIDHVLNQPPDLEQVPTVLNRTTLEMTVLPPQVDAPTMRIPRQIPPTASDHPPQELEHSSSQRSLASNEPPKTLRELVGRLLAKQPQERYADAAQLLRDLCTTAGMPYPAETAAVRESFLQAAQFVGREHELATLDAALSQAQQGQGGTWLIGGESGVGKSRLLDELRIRALVRGVPVLRGQAVREGGQPLAVWRDVVRHLVFMLDISDYEAGLLQVLVPELAHWRSRAIPPMVGTEMNPHTLERLLGVLQALLERVAEPLLILLEDVHWGADGLAAVMAVNTHHLILASYRHEEAPDLPAQLPACHVLHLSRLDAAGVEALSESMLGAALPELVERLTAESEGNLFFLVEMVRQLAEAAGGLNHVANQTLPLRLLTGGMQAVLERRLAHIPAVARPLLELAALAGRRLDLDLLGRLATLDLERWLNQCSAVLEFDDQHWRFAHDKLREALIAGIAPAELPTLHQRIALALESRQRDSDNAMLAYHWRGAANPYKEALYCTKTADQMIGSGMKFEALPYVERARELDQSHTLDPHQRVELLRVAGMTHQMNGLNATAQTELELALALAQELGDLVGETTVRVALGYLALVLSKLQEAKAYFERTLEVGQALDNFYAITRSLYGLGTTHIQMSRNVEAEQYLQQALALYEARGMRYYAAEMLSHLGVIARNLGNIDEAATRYHRALALALEVDAPRIQVPIRLGLSSVYYRRGETDKAIAEAEAVVALERQYRFRRGLASALSTLGLYLAVAGQHDRAEACWLECLTYFREANERLSLARAIHNLGDLYSERGDWQRAQAYLEESLTTFEAVGNTQGRLITIGKLASILLEQGAVEAAEERYHLMLNEAIPLKLNSDIIHAVYGLGRLKALRGDDAGAAAYLAVVAQSEAGYPDIRNQAQALLASLSSEPPSTPLTLEAIVATETK